jgi:DNA-binding CsgD family transcriptional regulator
VWKQTIWDLGNAEPDCPAATHSDLTSREREVARWVGKGKSTDEIATILGISPRTVEKHTENIRKKIRPPEIHSG